MYLNTMPLVFIARQKQDCNVPADVSIHFLLPHEQLHSSFVYNFWILILVPVNTFKCAQYSLPAPLVVEILLANSQKHRPNQNTTLVSTHILLTCDCTQASLMFFEQLFFLCIIRSSLRLKLATSGESLPAGLLIINNFFDSWPFFAA